MATPKAAAEIREKLQAGGGEIVQPIHGKRIQMIVTPVPGAEDQVLIQGLDPEEGWAFRLNDIAQESSWTSINE